MEAWTDVICNVGFPIAVAMYLLIRLEPKVDKMDKSVNQVNTTIVEMIKVVQSDVANTNKNTDAVKNFTKSIDDLKQEIRRFNNGNRKN